MNCLCLSVLVLHVVSFTLNVLNYLSRRAVAEEGKQERVKLVKLGRPAS